MVGVPTSKGCATCRKRSVKCDEIRPTCSQCRRGGRKCPGYVRSMKFVDENVKAAQRNNVLVKSCPDPPPHLSHPSYLNLTRLQIVANFVHDLFPQQTCHVKNSYVGGWLWQVPTIMRQDTTLDLAAEALASIYFAKRTGAPEKTDAAMMRSAEIYLRAIELLSRALRNPKACYSSEILCACLLLVHYERFSSLNGQSWLSHARGISQLIKLRGPSRHRSGIGHTILMASRGYIISEALVNGQSCFLEDQSWQNIQPVDTLTNSFPHHEGLNYFAQVPGLVQKARALDLQVEKNRTEAKRLHSKASQLRSKMLDWHIRANIVSKRFLHTPPNDAGKEGPYYHYDSSTTASFAVNYCSFMILINQTLDLLSGFNSHKEANEDLVENVVRSALYCSNTGFCSTQALLQALPIALTAVPENHPAYNDIRKWSKRLSESKISIKWNAKFPKDPNSKPL